MSMLIDSSIVALVRVDGVAIDRLKIDGVMAFPLSYTEMTAGHHSPFPDIHLYGFRSGTTGSLSEDTSISGNDISDILWHNSGIFRVDVVGSVSQDHFKVLAIETDQGIQKFFTGNADSYGQVSGETFWEWDLGTRPFTETNTYRAWFS